MHKTFIQNRFGENLETLIKYDGDEEKYPTVLFISGFGQDLHEYVHTFDEISDVLVKNGFLTIQFSFAGCGKSDGNYREMTLTRQAPQIKDVFEEMKNHPKIDQERIGILAQSFGVPSFIASLPLMAKSCVLVSGVVNPYENMRNVFVERKSFNPKGISSLPRSDGKNTSVGPKFWEDLKTYQNLPSNFKNFHGGVFVIHGTKDIKISVDEAQLLYGASIGKKRIKIFEGGDHGIVDVPPQMRQEFLQEITDWFTKTL